jgi:SNF2 family DNA or RNA helicase
LNIKLNQKIIQDMCGSVSFKRGDSFYRADKVSFQTYSADVSEATVSGNEDFHVVIKRRDKDGFEASCSCPKLASFQKDCQHVAAVLLAIANHQRKGTLPTNLDESSTSTSDLNHLLSLFSHRPKRTIGHQSHFENRVVLETEFTIKTIMGENNQCFFGLELSIQSTKIKDIAAFLQQIMKGASYHLSPTLVYDPEHYCFQIESDALIQQLTLINKDDRLLGEAPESRSLLPIPPSSWEKLAPLLATAPIVRLESNGKTFENIIFTEQTLPLLFDIKEAKNAGYQLSVRGLNSIIILEPYHIVLHDNQLFTLSTDDCIRLLELKEMLKTSQHNQLLIPEKQMDVFLDKIIPGLKKLGRITVAESITSKLHTPPLVAKLYLDRVHNKLLAGLEFHYENWIINPLEERELPKLIKRDVEKESEILQLMDGSQFAKTDGGYFLHNEDLEYDFLAYTVPKLQKLVQIYATTAVRNRIFREKAPPKIRVKVHKERTNWLEFKFEMDGIADQQIRDLLQAIEEKRKYYRLRNGSLLSLETKEFEEIQRFLYGLPKEQSYEDLEDGLNVPVILGLQMLDTVDYQPTFEYEETFRQFLDNFYHPEKLDFEVPPTLAPILRDYQTKGYKWLKSLANHGFGGILADDMGLGKTLQSIAFIVSELEVIRKNKQPVLIVSPSSLTYNWLSELLKFSPEIQAVVVDGTKEERQGLQKEVKNLDVVITSYPLLRRDIKWFDQQSFHTVFFDEAQAFKNPLTQTARAVKRIKADHRFALTGTPIENSLEELWSIFHVVFPELFLGLKEFSTLTGEKVARRIRPFLLRRLKEDVLTELPEKMESIESTELLPDQKKLYAAYLAKLRHDTLKHLDKNTLRRNRIKILAGLTRLRQICCHPALFVDGYKGRSAKFEQLLRIIEESRLSGRRVLIFSQFTKMLALIGKELTELGLPFFYLDGHTPPEERVDICQRFNEGERDYFLISLKAGGTGLNLTGADTVILYDLWWNPAVEEQAADRAHRIGQTKVVQVIKLISRGTIEEKMNELQEKKKNLSDTIIDSGDKMLTEEDIREILMI